MNARPFSRLLAGLLALALVGAALAWVFWAETPTGRVQGQVVLGDSGRPLAGAQVLLTPVKNFGRPVQTVRAETGPDGRFTLRRVPAGAYEVSGSSRAHKVERVALQVDEGKTSRTLLMLARSEPDLALAQHQRVFAATLPAGAGVTDKPFVSVRGYVDGKRAAGRDTLRVRVFETRLSRVLGDGEAFDALQRLSRSPDDEENTKKRRLPRALLRPTRRSNAPRLVFSRDVPITETDREGFFHKRLGLPAGRPGLFLVDVTHGNQAVCSWVVSTDMALVVKRAPANAGTSPQLLAFATDINRGTPLAGATVRTYRDGRVVDETQTGANGLADINVPSKARSEGDGNDSSRLLTVALRGSDEAVLARDEYGYEEQGVYAVASYTDRPLYRPGQQIFYKGIVRRKESEPGRYQVPAGLPVVVEIRDPGGERIARQTTTTGRFGSFSGQAELSPEAPTGTFTLIATVNGERHTSDIEVASYRKPEFAVTVAPNKTRYVRGDDASVVVEGKYYFGSPVAGAKIKYSVYRETDWSAEYPDDDAGDEDDPAGPVRGYGGDDVYQGYYGESVIEGEATLDENGRATIAFPTRPERKQNKSSDNSGEDEEIEGQQATNDNVDAADAAPQAETFTVSVTATDPAGREVEGTGAARVTAGDLRLFVAPDGYVAEPGRATPVIVVARDWDNKPVANLPVTLAARLGKWNAKTKRYEEQAQGAPQTATTGPDGRAVFSFTPTQAGELRLSATAKDPQQRPLSARTYLWAASDAGGDLPGTEYADLSLLTDKRRYAPGDTARVLVNTARTGQTVLLTLEGERIYRTVLVPITRRSTLVRLPVLAAYGPNVSLAACYVQNKHFAQSEIPLRVRVPQRELTVSVSADRKQYQPGDAITYAVLTKDAAGRPVPAELSFGVVDESLYALREDDPRLLRDAFYPRRWNRVQTDYSFAALYLGDADKAPPTIEARRRFPDTAYWNPQLRTGADGRATVRFTLPDTLTTWRATAVAQTLATALGRETNKVLVRKPFFVRLEAPRFVTQNDETRLLALVHNKTGARQNVRVRLETVQLTLGGDATQTLDLAPGEVGQAAFPVSVPLSSGNALAAHLRLTAWTGNTNAGRPFTDGVETTLPIRPHGRDDFQMQAGVLSGEAATAAFTLAPNAAPDASRLTIRVTPSVASALAPALDELAGFPYGCVEQTLSRFVPDLVVARLQRQTGKTLLSPERARQLPRMVRDGFSRLYRFQLSGGGWGWWENDKTPDPFMTAYALEGLGIAQNEGYAVSSDVLARGRTAARKLLGDYRVSRSDKAHLLYALALIGDTDTARRFLPAFRADAIPNEGLAYLVLLDHARGDTAGANARLDTLNNRARTFGGLRHWQTQEAPWQKSDRLLTALALRATLAVRPGDTEAAAPILRWLMASRTDTYWGNTRDTAHVLLALCDWLAQHPDDAAPTGAVGVRVNGRIVQTIALTPDIVREPEIVVRVPTTDLRPGANEVAIERTSGGTAGAGTLFWSATLRQTMVQEDIPAVSPSNLKVTREYLRVLPKRAGGDSWTLQTEPANGRVTAGEPVRVRLTLSVPRDMTYVLIEDAFPAGCEVTERGGADETVEWDNWYDGVDVRDDRIAFFARSLKRGTHTIEYNLRAQTPGTYHVLPALLQAMYAPEVRAESAEARLDVRK